MQNPIDYVLVPMTDGDIENHIVDLETQIFPKSFQNPDGPYTKGQLRSY